MPTISFLLQRLKEGVSSLFDHNNIAAAVIWWLHIDGELSFLHIVLAQSVQFTIAMYFLHNLYKCKRDIGSCKKEKI